MVHATEVQPSDAATEPAAPARRRLLTMQDLCALLQETPKTIAWRREQDPSFPKPIRLSASRTGNLRWIEAEVDAWIDHLVAVRDSNFSR